MASRKQPKSATSTSRKRKAAGKKDPAPPAIGSDPDELTAVERDPEQPLSFLPKERRPIAAQERLVDQLVLLMNIALEGSNNVGAEVRETYLTIGNVAQSMLWVALCAAKGPAPAAAKKALVELEHAALKVTSALAPDDAPMAPSAYWDLGEKYSLTGSKLALLDLVADALDGRVSPRERENRGRLNTRRLDRELSTRENFRDEVTARAEEVAQRIYYKLATEQVFAKLLVQPVNVNYAPEKLPPLTRAVALLMEQGNATVPQVARAVLFAFGSRNLKNLFTKKLLKKWEASRAARATLS